MKLLAGAERHGESFVTSATGMTGRLPASIRADEDLPIAIDNLHKFAYIAGFRDTMSGLSSPNYQTRIPLPMELKDGASFNGTVKLSWIGIGRAHRRPIHLRGAIGAFRTMLDKGGCQVCPSRPTRN
jgi:hypothetical protein